ncbi:DUF2971 domain-containing protein [Nostoc sp. CHAB 5844]|nr:DUF2971 domain-containing protein [Nostoc sp. CHAB 5844]
MIDFLSFHEYYEKNSGVRIADSAPEFSLYHYTDTNGLSGITQNNEVWATHYKYLNDASEILWGFNLFFFLLRERYKDNDSAELHENLNKFEAYARGSANVANIFIFCMSSEKNLLNQWRFYGGDQVSYSIAIDTKDYLSRGFPYTVFLYKMIYDINEQTKICNSIIDCIVKFTEENNDKLKTDEDIEDYIKQITALITVSLLRLKNPAFLAESEWRLVVVEAETSRLQDIKYRAGKYGLIPYLPVKTSSANNQIPIKEIVVGPGRYADLAHNSLSMFLERTDRAAISVDYSTIPIR